MRAALCAVAAGALVFAVCAPVAEAAPDDLTIVSAGADGSVIPANEISISADGRFVAFRPIGTPGGPAQPWVLRDLQTGTTKTVGAGQGPGEAAITGRLSDNGTFACWMTGSTLTHEIVSVADVSGATETT